MGDRSWAVGLMLAGAACGGGASSPIDAHAQPDAAAACGDGRTDPGEACDGDVVACATLAGTFAGGMAACGDTCRGWKVGACTRADSARYEFVKPAERDASRFSSARCNDGTAFTFAVRLAAQPSSTWVLHLGGGLYCDDYSYPCSARDAQLSSTRPEADRALGTLAVGGVFSRDPGVNPDFAGANHAFAFYCSSDFWAGGGATRRPSTGDPAQGWYFSGRANVSAMLSVLAERYGLDDAGTQTRVLWGGSSVGAFGAEFNAADVAAALPRTAGSGRLKLLVDAGWLTEWDDPSYRIGAATTSDHDVFSRARAFWNATFDPACETAADDDADCFFGPGWYPSASALMPTLVQQCSADEGNMSVHGILTTNTAVVDIWRAQVKTSLAGVTWLFSGDQPYHTLAISDEGMATGPVGARLRDVMGRFWAGATPERVEF